ncbi:hypothetical protein OEB99_02375 [Actinotalea sp. M2MS4P-6]|nr:hypothetical protein [Actinotalea sp. M2MS4P-6]MCV2393144.1 hypothetical protein [Actinotalea sp. M2MS4P-6]
MEARLRRAAILVIGVLLLLPLHPAWVTAEPPDEPAATTVVPASR